MANYDKASEPLEKVTTGEVIVKEKGLVSKLLAHAGTDADDLTRYLINDVAIPKLKDLLIDLIEKGSRRIVYGKTATKATSGNIINIRNYSAASTQSVSTTQTSIAVQESAAFDESSVILKTRSDAEAVLNSLKGRIAEFNVASVSDLYRLIGRSTSFTDRNWGWSNLDRAEIVSVRDGWLLKLPKSTSLR